MPIQGPFENWPIPSSSLEPEEKKTIHKVPKSRLTPSSTSREQNAKTQNFLHDRLIIAFDTFHAVFKVVAFIPSKLIKALDSVAHQLSGKTKSKTLAKNINNLSTLLKVKLSNGDTAGIFTTKCTPADKKKLLELLERSSKKIEQLNAPLIAEGMSELARSYFNLQAKNKLIRGKGNEMKEALVKLQDVLNWIVENQDKTEMGWTHLMIFAPSLFKLMKAENQTIQYKNANKLEKEFLTLILNKLIERPGDTEREYMLLPIMNQFVKGNHEIKQKLLDSLKTIEF